MATATQDGDLIVDLVGDRGIDWAVEAASIRAQDIVSHIIIISQGGGRVWSALSV